MNARAPIEISKTFGRWGWDCRLCEWSEEGSTWNGEGWEAIKGYGQQEALADACKHLRYDCTAGHQDGAA